MKDYMHSSNLTIKFDECQKYAERGDANSQFDLELRYYLDKGTEMIIIKPPIGLKRLLNEAMFRRKPKLPAVSR